MSIFKEQKMSKIKNITAKEIKDSRGNPTIEVELETDKKSFVASVPSGASTGKNEALELRDKDGKGVFDAISNINKIIVPKLKNYNIEEQEKIDKFLIELDSTENKSKLGANAILAVSMAVCRAGAFAKKIPLYKYISILADNNDLLKIPLPSFNILEGGAHAQNDLDIQEFMVVPQKKTFAENLMAGSKVFQNLKELLVKNYGEKATVIGDEGGFAPPISNTQQALYLLKSAIGDMGVKIAIDVAASQFYENPSPDGSGQVKKYYLDGKEFTRSALLDFYKEIINSFPIISIEDPFEENDWKGFEEITKELPNIAIIGDDLTTTNIKRIKEAHNKLACNGVILKLNQIGTVFETIEAGKLAKSFGWKTIVSHRSGETLDDFISDLAVGIGADFIKSGSPTKEERMVKYNRLLQIESELNKK
ncbi:MAG: phosphopyruvate hydratase [Candidatus Staskawiczbacteria bacterium RIFCSPLOWO2_01_FULL_33_9]|uniref:Enolase n=1 Tax=Candidatus Staskawiczbacteria bacterium RIFCSPLOWO2_01_FULL_33_9 TaxID=1802211 RepID=A0A1G2I934_9BACT|nr:MAG: phosphopyruvate hydratase [Candidatus Staskawiczbacteria bacterium RIFCSPLOWO2_01_FULL_33_9]